MLTRKKRFLERYKKISPSDFVFTVPKNVQEVFIKNTLRGKLKCDSLLQTQKCNFNSLC